MLAAGELPHIRRLIARGSRASLKSEKPISSPPIWTTISTGRRRQDHGIQSFITLIPGTGNRAELVLYGFPSEPGTLAIRLTSPEAQELTVTLGDTEPKTFPLRPGWQEIELDVERPVGPSPSLTLIHTGRWPTGATRPILGGGEPEDVAHTAGYDTIDFHGESGTSTWNLGDYLESGNLLKAGFYIETETSEDGRDFFWAGRPAVSPVTRLERRVPALWNILSDAGRSVLLVGHWATWPAETVRGRIVTDRVIYSNFNRDESALEDARGRTHPPELLDRLLPSLTTPDAVPQELLIRLGVDPNAVGWRHEIRRSSKVRAALASTVNYGRWAVELLTEEQPDYTFIYFDALDVISHPDFGVAWTADGDLDPSSPLAEAYRLIDEKLGLVLDVVDPRTRVLVVSDHGFEVFPPQELQKVPTELRVAHTGRHHLEGIFIAAGPGLAVGADLGTPSILDVTPTVLHLFGLPAARDMEGVPLPIDDLPPAPRIPSYGTLEPPGGEHPRSAAEDGLTEHLRSLGYVE